MGKTSIEWAEHTINPIRARNLETGAVGHFCVKISPECAHCYASDWNTRVRPSPSGKLIGTGLHFLPVNQPKVETFLDESKLDEVIRRRKPTAYFWCDMTDLFGDWVPDWMIDQCYAVMALTPRHRHMILTKRADRMRTYFTAPDLYPRILQAAAHIREKYPELASVGISDPALHPPRWIYKGVSAGNQPMADLRIPLLLQTPAAVRFISAEPLLGPVDLATTRLRTCRSEDPALDWVIVGGESGSGARPMHPDWARSLRDQCAAAGVKFFFKQWGEWAPATREHGIVGHVMPDTGRTKSGIECRWIGGDGATQFPSFHGLVEPIMAIARVGKKDAGRLLDGREWSEFPEGVPGVV